MNRDAWIGLRLSLGSVVVFWWAVVGASLYGLYYEANSNSEIKVSLYLVLAGLVVSAAMITFGFKFADRAHSQTDVGLPRAVYRLAGLMLVLVLVGLTIFAFATFANSFGISSTVTLVGRLVGTYLPILIAAGAIVWVLLSAVMNRKSSAEVSEGMSDTQKALALGYSVPVLGTAFAVILGLVMWDAQGRTMESWSWVIIAAVVSVSILLGTRFSAKAKLATPVVRAPKVAGASGAVALNFVLSVVFGAVVSVMSFSMMQSAIQSLNIYINNCTAEICYRLAALDSVFWMQRLLPTFVLLLIALGAVFMAVLWRNKEND